MKFRLHLIFSFLLLTFFSVFVWQARGWPLLGGLFPWVIGIPMMLIAVLQIVHVLKRGGENPSSESTPVDSRFTQGIDAVLARQRTINIFSWIFGFIASIWLLGFAVTVPLLVFLYLKVQSREGWLLSVVLAGVAWIMLWGLFDRLLHLPFPESMIFLYLEKLFS